MGIQDREMKAAPGPKDIWLKESLGYGHGSLCGRITPGGERRFYFRYVNSAGRDERLLIGPYSPGGLNGLTLAQARDRARDLSKLYREGTKDLREHFEQRRRDLAQQEADARSAAELARRAAQEEQAQRAAAAARRVTVRRLFEQWQQAELAPHVLADSTRTGRKDGGEWVRQAFERRVFPVLGDTAAEDVKRADLLAILDDTKAQGRRRTANVLLADLRQMFRFAAEREIVLANPLTGIRRDKVGGKDVERSRVLDDDEIQELAARMPAARMAPRSATAPWLILSTACRVGEAMGARWEHVDLKGRRWYLPETKNERDHTIHLSDFALLQMNRLLELREVCPDGSLSPWLFPASDPAKPVCTKSFGKQLADRQRPADRRLTNRTTATQALALRGGRWTAHDLRRTAATLMARLGFSADVIDECLNHKLQSRVARVYIRDRRLGEQARAFDAVGERLQLLTDLSSQLKASASVMVAEAA